MKLMLAKMIYWTGIVSMIGITLGCLAALAWFVITTIPFFLAILAVLGVLIVLGMLMGWAESVMEKDKRYKN